ncbi:MAG: CDP-diacylglycerol--serine O-phosphatidyltransferase [Chloroflexi bacterium]|nr:CDP-diacylglycerol--serine O-phosphatidyltransferase [Chloroflexota bacterium]
MPTSEPRPLEGALLPTLLTTGNLLCGFAAVVAAAHNRFGTAAALIFLGMAFDILDGQVARWIGIATDFGIEYDSLADVITFGLAPALLTVQYALDHFGRWGWVSGFLFVVGAALRLARFNIRATRASDTHFQGLPTPAAAGTLAALVLLFGPNQAPPEAGRVLLLLLPPGLAMLMVSTLPYRHVKHGRRGVGLLTWLIVGFAALLALIVAAPRWVLPLLFGGYALSGPVAALRRAWLRRRRPSS